MMDLRTPETARKPCFLHAVDMGNGKRSNLQPTLLPWYHIVILGSALASTGNEGFVVCDIAYLRVI